MNKDFIEESLLILVMGMLTAVSFVAILGGDGNKGLLDLFQ